MFLEKMEWPHANKWGPEMIKELSAKMEIIEEKIKTFLLAFYQYFQQIIMKILLICCPSAGLNENQAKGIII